MKDLNNNEIIQITGGADPDGCSGCSAGVAFREWLGDLWDAMSPSSAGTWNSYYGGEL